MQRVAQIQMPEGGIVNCRMPEGAGEHDFPLGSFCLCELDYGQDIGRLIKFEELQPNTTAPAFHMIRQQTPNDAAHIEANAELAQKAKQAFQLAVRYEKAHVKVLHIRFSFDHKLLFIRYSAAAAVDLRRFVSQIQRDYKTQVDLWQVGIRDEAALVGCIGVCGRAACCCSWQHRFPNPSTRMAKAQDVPLNPVTANGRCGRLKCCFSFEYEQYSQAGRDLPEVGSTVRCLSDKQGENGIVVNRDVMRGELTVRTREGRILKLMKEDILLVHAARPCDHAKGDSHEDSVGEWSEP